MSAEKLDEAYDGKTQGLDIDELFENINAGLFKNHMGGSIRFHIISHDKNLKKKYEELILVYGGRIVEENEVSNKTAILVDGLTKHAIRKITFKINYVLDCIRKNALLELSPYKLGYHSDVSSKSYLDVLFWAKEDFPDLENVNPPEEEIISDTDIEISSVPQHTVRFKRTRAPYSINEKEAILKFIINSRKYASLRGDNVWKTMECRKICPRRTYQSMKEHFWKTIRQELDRFTFLSEEQKFALKNNTALRKTNAVN